MWRRRRAGCYCSVQLLTGSSGRGVEFSLCSQETAGHERSFKLHQVGSGWVLGNVSSQKQWRRGASSSAGSRAVTVLGAEEALGAHRAPFDVTGAPTAALPAGSCSPGPPGAAVPSVPRTPPPRTRWRCGRAGAAGGERLEGRAAPGPP